MLQDLVLLLEEAVRANAWESTASDWAPDEVYVGPVERPSRAAHGLLVHEGLSTCDLGRGSAIWPGSAMHRRARCEPAGREQKPKPHTGVRRCGVRALSKSKSGSALSLVRKVKIYSLHVLACVYCSIWVVPLPFATRVLWSHARAGRSWGR